MTTRIKFWAHEVQTWGWRTAFYNARFMLGYAILPGSHKHVSVRAEGDELDCCD